MSPDINPSLPAAGQPNATEDLKVITALSQLVATVNDLDTANFADLSVTTAKLAAAAVTSPKIADGAVTSPKFKPTFELLSGTATIVGNGDTDFITDTFSPTYATQQIFLARFTVPVTTTPGVSSQYLPSLKLVFDGVVQSYTIGTNLSANTSSSMSVPIHLMALWTVNAAAGSHTAIARVSSSAASVSFNSPNMQLFRLELAQ